MFSPSRDWNVPRCLMLSWLCSRIRTDFRRCDFKYSMPVMIQVWKSSPNRNENEAQEVQPVTQARVWAQTSLCCQTSHITGEEGVKEGVCEQAWCSADILAASGLCPDPLPQPPLPAIILSTVKRSPAQCFWKQWPAHILREVMSAFSTADWLPPLAPQQDLETGSEHTCFVCDLVHLWPEVRPLPSKS